MSSFSFIRPQNQLWKEAKISKTHQRILERITSLPQEIRKDKFNMELLKMVCCMIEHSIDNTGKKEKMKIDKKGLAVQVLNSLFDSLSPQDINTIITNIEYLHDNNHIIKYHWSKVVISSCADWFKKKVLS
jgi:translation initiation factor 2B subunit (eIF-2B alpha/beta/delta family)